MILNDLEWLEILVYFVNWQTDAAIKHWNQRAVLLLHLQLLRSSIPTPQISYKCFNDWGPQPPVGSPSWCTVQNIVGKVQRNFPKTSEVSFRKKLRKNNSKTEGLPSIHEWRNECIKRHLILLKITAINIVQFTVTYHINFLLYWKKYRNTLSSSRSDSRR